jgi:hypothetical protein
VPPGAAAVAGLRADYATIWLKNHALTNLRAGPGDQEPLFSELPQWTSLKQMEVRGDWTLVYYGGDGASRVAGPGWVRTADTGRIGTPTPWLQTAQVATLWSSERSDATTRVVLPRGVRLETMGVDGIVGERVHVRTPGDGRSVAPAEGWIDAGATASIGSLTASQVPWAFPAVLNADLLLTVPYRTQIDGTDFASANCGPTALGMVLERYGIDIAPKTLRGQVLEAQENDRDDDDAGSFIWSLDDVARSYGLKTFGLYEADGSTLRHWSIDDVRNELRHNNPVVVQVRYRYLPRRQESEYYGDHYVVITGLMGDSFLYNDPIWGPGENEGPGWDRLMTAADLTKAMNASDGKYAYAAFAVGR